MNSLIRTTRTSKKKNYEKVALKNGGKNIIRAWWLQGKSGNKKKVEKEKQQ